MHYSRTRAAPWGMRRKKIKIRHIANCLKADPAYGEGVANALGIDLNDVPKVG
jgi:catalase